jgi:tRNA modification GTPase
MLARQHDPICAIATAPGRGAVGIVRVSGQNLRPLLAPLLGAAAARIKPREALYTPFLDAQAQPIDQGLALFFPAPHSFTGEDVLELQGHGGPVVLQMLLSRCLQAAAGAGAENNASPVLPGLRIAQPGEFAERAFLNDKIDLAQAEAIADLIDASTEQAVRSATRSMSGAFSHEVTALKDALIHLRMLVEATLDFPEEEIDFLKKADAAGQLERIEATLARVRQQARQGALLREGITVVIAGQPNAGKSSLLNALAGAELAIVTPIAGTTRDKVQQTIQIEGVPLHIVDTAGLRESSDEVERIGIERAWGEIHKADAVIFLRDLSRHDQADYRAADAELARALLADTPVLEIWNKLDKWGGTTLPTEARPDAIALSAKQGTGLEALRQRLLQLAGWQAAPEGVFMARERHVQALARTTEHVELASAHLRQQAQALDLLAEELRLAHAALSEITGEFTPDDLLGEIFTRFCIGK